MDTACTVYNGRLLTLNFRCNISPEKKYFKLREKEPAKWENLETYSNEGLCICTCYLLHKQYLPRICNDK